VFIFVVLTLFSDWKWVDATQEEISMGLEFTSSKVVFLDMDGDEDEDMLRPGSDGVKAFENTTDEPDKPLWTRNNHLAQGIDWVPSSGGEHSLGAGDLDGSGSEEIVIVDGSSIFAYVNIDTAWVKDTTFFDDLHEDSIPWHPDFADVDGDSDMDMLGGWEDEEHHYLLAMWWNTGTPQEPQWEYDSTYFKIGNYLDPVDMMQYACWIDWNNDDVMDVVFVRWYYDHDCNDVDVLINRGSGTAPEWDEETAHSITLLDDIAVLDWNSDDIQDIVLVDYYMHPEGYLYVPGEFSGDSVLHDCDHPFLWGGIHTVYPAAADVNADNIPELALINMEYHWDFEFPMPKEYYIPHMKRYSFSTGEYNLWQRESETIFWSLEPPDDDPLQINPAHLQYVDFGNDGLLDYVLNLDGANTLYRNQGTAEQPVWVKDEDALQDLPELFPSCLLDVDSDGDMDVIGVSIEDSLLTAYINTRSDANPNYMQYEALVSGLEGIRPTYFAAGDITDNDLNLADLAVGIKNGKLTAFFNSGQNNPRWQRHDEVFKSLGISGNPCLCDGDGDGDLDLYLVTGGRLRYYRNESTGGIAESLDRPPSVTTSLIGHEVEVRLTVGTDSDKAALLLYNVAGQRIAEYSRRIEDGEASFRIVQQPGVYFYRLDVENQEFRGKIVIY